MTSARIRGKLSTNATRSKWVSTVALALVLLGVITGCGANGRAPELIDPFYVGSRDRLAICVMAVNVDPAIEGEAQRKVQEAFRLIARDDARWKTLGYDHPAPIVDIGCPVGPAAFDPTAPADQIQSIGEPRRVSEASQYRAFVFVIPDDVYEALFNAGSRLTVHLPMTVEELLCEAENCRPVTSAWYYTPRYVSQPGTMQFDIARAIGLPPGE